MAEYYRDEDEHPAPPIVVAAVACGTTPVPFLAVYAVMFLVHGSVHPVVPPDITSTTRGEFLSGLVAAALFVACSVSLIWAISGRRRWPFVTVQTLMFVSAGYFLVDGHKGGDLVSSFLLVVTLAALVLILLPAAWGYYGPAHLPRRRQSRHVRSAAGAGSSPIAAEETMPSGSTAAGEARPPAPWVTGRPSPQTTPRGAVDPGDPQA